MSEKKLCYALVYTGSNKKILARTILFYEILKGVTKKDIFIITDSKENYEKILKYVPEENIYAPKNMDKYLFEDVLIEGRRYPNIFLKFSIFELKNFGYTHGVVLDSDLVIGNEDLIKHISFIEKEFLKLNPGEFACQKYRIGDITEERKTNRFYTGGCLAFNIEVDFLENIFKYKIPEELEENTISRYSLENFVFDIPQGLITNNPLEKQFCIFFHTGTKLFYSVLKTTQPENYERFKYLCEQLENYNEDSLF